MLSRRRFPARQGHVHTADQQAVFDRTQALRAFGMPRTHFMLQTIGMGEITCGAHEKSSSLLFRSA